MIRELTIADLDGVNAIIESNAKYYFEEKPDWFTQGMLARNLDRLSLDRRSVFFGYFQDDVMLAYGRFTRWDGPHMWSMNHVSTLRGAGLPKTYGGKSADVVYDIINRATIFFELEGRNEFWMFESVDELWESLTSNPNTYIYQRYTREEGRTYPAGYKILPSTGPTYLYYGDVITPLRTVTHRKKLDVSLTNGIAT